VVAKSWSNYLGTVFGFSGGTTDLGPLELDWGALLIIAIPIFISLANKAVRENAEAI